jgi:hypothetical protein
MNIPSLQGMHVVKVLPSAIYLRIDPGLRRPIDGGCSCTYCRNHPDSRPMWDTLAIPLDPIGSTPDRRGTWTVHAPEWTIATYADDLRA